MIQLINFWTELVYNGEKEFDAVPDKIKGAVMEQLIKSGAVTNDNIEDVKAAKIAEMSVACNEVITQGWLGLGIWDYSNMPFNILGQICLPFSLLWVVLSACAIVIDDYERYWFFGEEKPYYLWKFKEKK